MRDASQLDRTHIINRSFLVPEYLLEGASQSVKAAQKEALTRVEEAEQARETLRLARVAEIEAPELDELSLTQAVSSGAPVPAPTADVRARERKVAQAVRVDKEDKAWRAVRDLHRTVLEHQPALLKKDDKLLTDEYHQAQELAAQLTASVSRLSSYAGTRDVLMEADAYLLRSEVEQRVGGREAKKYVNLGKLDFSRDRVQVFSEVVAGLSAIDKFIPTEEETVGQRLDREAEEAAKIRAHRPAKHGVYVGNAPPADPNAGTGAWNDQLRGAEVANAGGGDE